MCGLQKICKLKQIQLQMYQEALKRVEPYSWDHARVLLFEMFNIPWQLDYESPQFTKHYNEFLYYIQDQSYDTFLNWFFFYYIMRIFQDMQPPYRLVFEGNLLYIVLLLIAASLKQPSRQFFTARSRFYLQSLVIMIYGVILSSTGLGWGALTSSMTIDSLAIKIITIVMMSLRGDEPLFRGCLALVGIILCVYLEMKRYASFINEYRQIARNKIETRYIILLTIIREILITVLSSQGLEQNFEYYRNIQMRIEEEQRQEEKKIDLIGVLFDED